MTPTAPQSLAQAATLSSSDLLALHRDLSAPTIDEIVGEHPSAFPHDTEADARDFFVRRGRGLWLGKAYSAPCHDAVDGIGEGYNLWRHGDTVVRAERFSWRIEPSATDGRDALVMRYRAFGSVSGALDLVDEVRTLVPGSLFLGIYHTRIALPGFTGAQRGPRSGPAVFLLGPATEPTRGVDDASAETGHRSLAHVALGALTAPPRIRPWVARATRRLV
ncbi:hypothetical protein [Williamsia herbipolensis]|uniref:hypothetical protein n=1 Tax=Williamsia herbipolensis TaxID=1603258 RepID=UPI0005F84578|nr:hypothetical protein [Williamsia herbipolensis]